MVKKKIIRSNAENLKIRKKRMRYIVPLATGITGGILGAATNTCLTHKKKTDLQQQTKKLRKELNDLGVDADEVVTRHAALEDIERYARTGRTSMYFSSIRIDSDGHKKISKETKATRAEAGKKAGHYCKLIAEKRRIDYQMPYNYVKFSGGGIVMSLVALMLIQKTITALKRLDFRKKHEQIKNTNKKNTVQETTQNIERNDPSSSDAWRIKKSFQEEPIKTKSRQKNRISSPSLGSALDNRFGLLTPTIVEILNKVATKKMIKAIRKDPEHISSVLKWRKNEIEAELNRRGLDSSVEKLLETEQVDDAGKRFKIKRPPLHFPKDAEEAMRQEGFSPEDLGVAILWGFNLETPKKAMGAVHFHKKNLEKNLDRYFYYPHEFYDFFVKYDLIIFHKGITKDDVSFNPHPNNPIGAKIAEAIKKYMHEYEKMTN